MDPIYILRWDVEEWVQDEDDADDKGSIVKGEMSCDYSSLEDAMKIVAMLKEENAEKYPDRENCRMELFKAYKIEIQTDRTKC